MRRNSLYKTIAACAAVALLVSSCKTSLEEQGQMTRSAYCACVDSVMIHQNPARFDSCVKRIPREHYQAVMQASPEQFSDAAKQDSINSVARQMMECKQKAFELMRKMRGLSPQQIPTLESK